MANNKETFLNLTSDKRETTIYGLPADGKYRVEIEAFRVVDQDIDADGVIESIVAVAPASPYQPSPTVSLGDGVLSGGTPIKTIVDALKNNAGQIIQVKDLVAGFADLEATFGNTATSKTNADAAEAAKLVAQAASTNATKAYTDSQTARDAAQAAQGLAAGSASNASTSASNANTSAATAAQAKIDAQSASSAADAAKQLALGYRDQTASSAQTASKAVTDANTAKTAAQTAATASQTSASNASGFASTASGQATIATQKATDAGTFASNASASASTASTQAGNASTSASNAATSATNALGSANSASSSAGVAAITAGQATQTVASTMPSDFSQSDLFWMNGFQGSSDARPIAAGWTFPTVSGEGIVAQGATISQRDISHRGVTAYVANRKYRAIVRAKGSSDQSGLYVYDIIVPNQNAISPNTPLLGYTNLTTSFVDYSFDFTAGGGQPAYHRILARALSKDGSAQTIQISRIILQDVTSELAAQAAATASATSASNAATSQNAAGTSASAANTSAVNAATSAGNAGVSQYNAAVSEQNAAGSANTATLQAGVAASSASSANARLAEMMPSQVNLTATGWTLSDSGSPAVVATYAINPAQITFANNRYGVNAGSSGYIRSVQVIPATAGAIYEVSAELELTFGGSAGAIYPMAVVRGLNAAFTSVGDQRTYNGKSWATAGTTTITAVLRVSDVADTSRGILAWPAGSVWLRIGGGWAQDVAGSSGRTLSVAVRDVTAEVNSAKSASAAAGSASTASASQTAAGQSATAAQASAATASTKAGEASALSASAATSETNALGSKNSAAISSGVAATAALDAAGAAASGNNNPGTAASLWTHDWGTFAPTATLAGAISANPNYYIVNGRVRVKSNGQLHVGPLKPTPYVKGRRYRYRAALRAIVAGDSFEGLVQCWDKDGANIGYTFLGGNALTTTQDTVSEFIFEYQGDGVTTSTLLSQYSAADRDRVAWVRPVVIARASGANNTAITEIVSLSMVDIESEYAAKISASAASVSAIAASASQTAAGQSASAAKTSETNAGTSAGTASVKASEASTSASNALGSANSATASQIVSASTAAQATQTVAADMPSDFSQGDLFWMAGFQGNSDNRPVASGWSFPTVSGEGVVAQSPASTGGVDIGHRSIMASVPGRRYRAVIRAKSVSASAGLDVFQIVMGSQNASAAIATPFIQSVNLTTSFVDYTVDFVATSGPYQRLLARIISRDGTSQSGQIARISLTDVTDVVAAQTAATASAGSASLAQTKADAAGISASAALASQTAANTSAGNASTSASQASTSATNALGSANSATTSQASSATSAAAASAAVKATVPDNFTDPTNWQAWNNWSGSVTFTNGLANIKLGGSFVSNFRIPVVAGETYRVTARHRTINQGGGSTYIGTVDISDTGAGRAYAWWISAKATAAVNTWEVSTFEVTAAQIYAQHGAVKSIGIAFLTGYSATSDAEVSMFRIENITSEKAARDNATASATSASSAAASKSGADQSASAANLSATNAATKAGEASTSASNASTSASNASGSANTASTQASLASTAKSGAETAKSGAEAAQQAAAGSASSANTSAGIATSKADAAGTSASAANQSKIDAQAANAAALASAQAANTSQVNASAAASSASTSAMISSSYSSGSSGVNDKFANWPDAVINPTGWTQWAGDNAYRIERVAGGSGSAYSARTITTSDGGNSGFWQTLAVYPAKWVVTVTAMLEAGSWNGAGVVFNGLSTSITFATEADSAGTTSASLANQTRTWSKLIDVTLTGNGNLHAMHGWSNFGATPSKTLRWYQVSMRPANAAEIAGNKALIDGVANTAAISTNTASISSLQQTVTNGLGSLAIRADVLEVKAGSTGTTHVVRAKGFYGSLTSPSGLFTGNGTRIGIVPSRGYNVYIKNLNDDNWVSQNFDTFGAASRGIDMGNMLGTAATGSIVVVISDDEPQTNRLQAHLINWMQNSGAGAAFTSPSFKLSSAYVLIGTIRGGYGSGREFYAGSSDYAGDAFIDRTFARVGNSLSVGDASAVAVRDLTARVSTTEGVLATVGGRTEAYLVQDVSAGNGRAIVSLRANGVSGSSNIDLAASQIRLINSAGNVLSPTLSVQGGNVSISGDLYMGTGRIVSKNGSFMKVQGSGFGSSNQFLEWYGPTRSTLEQCTESIAITYLRTDGQAYFGGMVAEGQLRSIKTTSELGLTQVANGPLVTNGRTRTWTAGLSVRRTGYRVSAYAGPAGWSATFVIEQFVDNAWSQRGEVGNLVGYSYESGNNGYASPSEPAQFTQTASGSVTFNDTTGGTTPFQVRARIISLSTPAPSGNAGTVADSYTQVLTINTYEV